ncbi:hypothetical protein ZIOFF_070038 [Zingiber officinale]|uniref:ATP-dependent DNA ligase family profile domain-containing protein n=1 Tax=Zingiber officinale TaxID=94328 RepID=A0A8J5CCI3_ZINOF|nr:hypothetical protein ZIOFF_070038 [Zingiber officinale]
MPLLHGQTDFHPDLLIFGTNSFYTFSLNLTIFLLVVKTTALTMNIASIIKDGLLIAFSRSIIGDTITPINLFLYHVTFLSISYYNKGPHVLFSHHIHPPLGFPYIFHELMKSKGRKKFSSSSLLHYEAPLPLGYSIEDFLPHGRINKFQSVAYSNVEADQAFTNNQITLDRVNLFIEEARNSSCEGIMVKTLDDFGYSASKRCEAWLKVKRDYVEGIGDSLDLVLIGACHKNGRKAGWIRSLVDNQKLRLKRQILNTILAWIISVRTFFFVARWMIKVGFPFH